MRIIFLVGLLLYSIAVRADMDDYIKCHNSTQVELSKKIPFIILLGETSDIINSAKKIMKFNREIKPEEKAAIKSFLTQNRRCEELLDVPIDRDSYPSWSSLEFLADGFINLAQFGRLQLEELNVVSLFEDYLKQAKDLRKERDELRNELSRRREEVAGNTVLSCVVESGYDKAIGVEFLIQINEANKTITSNRGGGIETTSVVIGETSIYFKQNQVQTTISRATGKFTNSGPSFILVGTCKKIAQKAF